MRTDRVLINPPRRDRGLRIDETDEPVLVQAFIAKLAVEALHVRVDGAGEDKSEETPVFSDETGEPIKNFRKTWVLTVLRAHGVTPHWRKEGGWKHLTRECQQQLQTIDLHWHDLRHEYASRLVERNVPLAQVRDLLGHASIVTTERYDNQKLESLQLAAARLDTGGTFDTSPRSARPVCQVFVKNAPEAPSIAPSETHSGSDANCLEENNLDSWYRYGDMTPTVSPLFP